MMAEDDKHRKRDREVKQGLGLLAAGVVGIMILVAIWQKSVEGRHSYAIVAPPNKLRRKSVTLLKDSLPVAKVISHHHHQQGGARKRAEERMHLEHLSSKRGMYQKLSGTDELRQLLKEKNRELHRKVDPER
jgi:hypothetical protein